jgi:formamidopyrimidine-DNA glycosylase
MHLGMSGTFRVLRSGREQARKTYYYDVERLETHDHVVFEMSNGFVAVFNDPRRFGFILLLRGDEIATHATLSRLGPEPLARSFSPAALARELGRRTTSLKIALADQRVIAGLGNIYVVEALHRAGLSPKRRASTLVTPGGQPKPALLALVAAIRQVLNEAIRRQYRTGADNPFLVYDREGEPCPRRGCPGTIRRIVQGGRSTFFCPACQK